MSTLLIWHRALVPRSKASNPLLRVSAGRVTIDTVASGDVHALQADLEALGMQGAVAVGCILSGQLPIAAINALTTLAGLQNR